jgi:hypothetical protein
MPEFKLGKQPVIINPNSKLFYSQTAQNSPKDKQAEKLDFEFNNE